VSAAEVTACYSVNTSGFFLDTAVTATNTGTNSTPTVTSGTASMRGNLYFGICANDSSRTFTQDAGNGWASPPSDTGVNNAINLAGGNKTSTGITAQTFAPTLSGSTPWNVAIFAFVSADLFSYYEPLTTPTRHDISLNRDIMQLIVSIAMLLILEWRLAHSCGTGTSHLPSQFVLKHHCRVVPMDFIFWNCRLLVVACALGKPAILLDSLSAHIRPGI
jgi:hypothetical protein